MYSKDLQSLDFLEDKANVSAFYTISIYFSPYRIVSFYARIAIKRRDILYTRVFPSFVDAAAH